MAEAAFLFADTAAAGIYTLSLHDALPILTEPLDRQRFCYLDADSGAFVVRDEVRELDRKSTRLNSSHANISYAVFCLKKKHSRGRSWYPARKSPRRRGC